jgi:hypothetical protein
MNKVVLLASFIFKDRLDWFINYLSETFNISKNNIFVYDINDEYKYMVTYKFIIEIDKRINFKEILPNATVIHKKGNAIYSINALNKLIETTNTESIGNINHKSIKVNWEEYQNKLLLIRNNNLIVSPIIRIL